MSKSTPSSAKDEAYLRTLPELGKLLRDIAVATAAVSAAVLPLTTWGSFFGLDFSWVKSLGAFGMYFVVLHALIAGVTYGSVMMIWRIAHSHPKNEQGEGEDNSASAQKLSGGLVEEVRTLYQREQFVETVRFGMMISRPLWLSGRYKDRVLIGAMAEDAAARLGLTEEQIQLLLDDIGWTHALIGHVGVAERNIRYGVELAVRNGLFYWAAKGERHLAGIADWYKGQSVEAGHHLKSAQEHAQKIADPDRRKEMAASLLYAQAEFDLTNGRLDDALRCSEQAREAYISLHGQEERVAKVHSQLGRIYLKLGSSKRAKDAFRQGLAYAHRVSRADEQARNLMGLGEAHLLEGEYSQARNVLEQALAILKEMGLKNELRQCQTLIERAQIESCSQSWSQPSP